MHLQSEIYWAELLLTFVNYYFEDYYSNKLYFSDK